MEMDCLERKLGTGDNILKTGKSDIDVFPAKNIIAGPLTLNPLDGKRWECPVYESLSKHFEIVKKLDRERIYNFVCHTIEK